MVRDNFKPTLFLNKALNFYPPPEYEIGSY